MKYLPLLLLIGCAKFPVEPPPPHEHDADSVVVSMQSDFRALFAQEWYNVNYKTSAAQIRSWVTVGYTGAGTENEIMFETMIYYPGPSGDIGERLDSMLTLIPAPGGSWDTDEAVRNFSHISDSSFSMIDERGLGLFHRLIEVGSGNPVAAARVIGGW